MKFALDAGHGSKTGAAENGLVEDDVALDMVKRIGHHLRLAGHETVCTRSNKKLVALSRRGRIAIDAGCRMFISIHCNAGPSTARGVEGFVAEGDKRSAGLAKHIVGRIAKLGMKNRDVKWDSQSQHSRLRVLRDTYKHMPAVLLEVGFLTNPNDAKLLSNPQFKERMAQAIAAEMIAGI
ncbi:N-acetylmuramoyl-L-alanine amidase [bacterium]|nr:N-acetylmuramoyl-L-alanine amidase [bacterium]